MAPADPAFTPIAETGGNLADFGPYVAAINDAGIVAFRAQRPDGHTGLFLGDGGPLTAIEVEGDLIGHPDINNAQQVSYLTRTAAGPACWLRSAAGIAARAHDGGEIADLGPRGPVMNESGSAVFRAQLRLGGEAVYCAADGRLDAVLRSDESFLAFPGLPVLNRSGAVAFAAEFAAGGCAILLREGGRLTTIADTSDEFRELGRFPALSEAGQVAFTGTLKSGRAGLFLSTAGGCQSLTEASSPFVSLRSVLLDGSNVPILCATRRGGELGIYRGTGAQAKRILGLGDVFLDSTVTDFALNAVSVNAHGQLAVRVRLANGRQFILRAETGAP